MHNNNNNNNNNNTGNNKKKRDLDRTTHDEVPLLKTFCPVKIYVNRLYSVIITECGNWLQNGGEIVPP